MSKVKLPKFRKPPIIETVAGLRFREINLGLQDFLELQEIFSKYKKVSAKDPIPQVGASSQLILMPQNNNQKSRYWFESENNEYLLQIQNDGIWFNWRKEKEKYPHYEALFKMFTKCRESFEKYVKQKYKSSLVYQQLDLNYVSFIPYDDFGGAGNLNKLFSFLSKDSIFDTNIIGFQTILQKANLENQSTINISITPMHDIPNGKMGIRLEIREIKNFSGYNPLDIESWFSLARKNIVLTFSELTTGIMHKKWEKY